MPLFADHGRFHLYDLYDQHTMSQSLIVLLLLLMQVITSSWLKIFNIATDFGLKYYFATAQVRTILLQKSI